MILQRYDHDPREIRLHLLPLKWRRPEVVQDRTTQLLNDHLGKAGVTAVDKQEVRLLSKELSDIIIGNDMNDRHPPQILAEAKTNTS